MAKATKFRPTSLGFLYIKSYNRVVKVLYYILIEKQRSCVKLSRISMSNPLMSLTSLPLHVDAFGVLGNKISIFGHAVRYGMIMIKKELPRSFQYRVMKLVK